VKIEPREQPLHDSPALGPTAVPERGRRHDLSLGRIPKARRPLGAAILVAVILTVIAVRAFGAGEPGPDEDLIVVDGYGGPLKYNFLTDPQVAAILAERYGLTVDLTPIGSIAMLGKACDGSLKETDDFLWAGDQSTLDIYRGCGGAEVGADNVYLSPLVIYSWTEIVDALVAAGIATAQADGTYTIDAARLVEFLMGGGTFDQLGLTKYHGEILVHTSDPGKSNSGFLFAGLLANILNGGKVVTATTVDPLLPDVAAYFHRLGFMEETSGELFAQFMMTGPGAKPMLVGYESQVSEFLVSYPTYRDQVVREVRLLYPQPTIWATHPLIARTDHGELLLNALKDPDIQRLAWERHGQRPGVLGIPIDATPGILQQITSVIDMPAAQVMDTIREAITPASDDTAQAPTSLATTGVTTAIERGRTRSRPR
jgi:hypothetical protein